MTKISAVQPSWRPLSEIDKEGAAFNTITVTTDHLHLPIGLDRSEILINPAPLALVGITIGARYVALSSYSGETSRPDFGVESLESNMPVLNDMVAWLKKAELGYARLMETGAERAEKVLYVAANTAEILHRMSLRDDESSIDPVAWAPYLDRVCAKYVPPFMPGTLSRLRMHYTLKPGSYVTAR